MNGLLEPHRNVLVLSLEWEKATTRLKPKAIGQLRLQTEEFNLQPVTSRLDAPKCDCVFRLKNDPAEQSPIKLLLPLIKNVAQCYQNRNEALKLLLHLLQLHSPDSQELFTPEIQSPFSDSDSSVDGLTELVKTFVLNNKIFVDAEPDFKFLLVSIQTFNKITFLLYYFYRILLLSLRAHSNVALLVLLLRYFCII